MIEYSPSDNPEFTAHEYQGNIYHQRGSYALEDEGALLVPVNRSYVPVEPGPGSGHSCEYKQDKVIHDTIPSDLDTLEGEAVISILGKRLLFIRADAEHPVTASHPSSTISTGRASDESMRLVDGIRARLGSAGMDISVGVHGSHAMGINGPTSDMDLIAWAPRDGRADAVDAINESLLAQGYVDANTTSRFERYSTRIANLTGLPIEVGAHLASLRHRWTSPGGVSTSLQCIHADYDHTKAISLINGAINEGFELAECVDGMRVEVLDGGEPFNYPRMWTIGHNGGESRLLSFNMVHQTMGSDGRRANSSDGPYSLRATRYVSDDGKEVYLMKHDGHYLLPQKIADFIS